MPQKLHHSARRRIIQLSIGNPLPKLDVILARPSMNLTPRDRKLRATCRANLLRLAKIFLARLLLPWRGRVQRGRTRAFEDIPPDLLGDVAIKAMGLLAAGIPVAAEIDVAVSLDEVELEHAHRGDVIVKRGVDVPCHEKSGAVGVEKGDCGG